MMEPIGSGLAFCITGSISKWRVTDEALLNTWEDFQDLQERAVGVANFSLPRRDLKPLVIGNLEETRCFSPLWVSLTCSNASRLILTLHPTFPAFLERIEIEVREKRVLEFLISREIVEKLQFPYFLAIPIR